MNYFNTNKNYLASLKIASFAIFLFCNLSNARSQTTVFSDDYERTEIRKGGTPATNYQLKTIDANGSNWQIHKNALVLQGKAAEGSGKNYISGSLENWAAPFKNVLSANSGTITCSFLLRSTASYTGFATNQYEAAVMLACNIPDFTNKNAKGYAVYISKGKLGNAVHFGEFT